MCTAINLSKGGGGLDCRFPEFHKYNLSDKELADLINEVFGTGTVAGPLEDRYNIRITDPLPVIINQGQRKLDFYRFGLVPSLSKDTKIATRLFNARSETVAEKPSFRVLPFAADAASLLLRASTNGPNTRRGKLCLSHSILSIVSIMSTQLQFWG